MERADSFCFVTFDPAVKHHGLKEKRQKINQKTEILGSTSAAPKSTVYRCTTSPAVNYKLHQLYSIEENIWLRLVTLELDLCLAARP